jgi:hypothetical protein
MDSQFLSIFAQIPLDSIVVCVASKRSKEKYWIAKILSEQGDNPPTYKVRFYDWSIKQHAWILQKDKKAYRTCPHDSIILLGIQFNLNGILTAATLNHINFVLQKYDL